MRLTLSLSADNHCQVTRKFGKRPPVPGLNSIKTNSFTGSHPLPEGLSCSSDVISPSSIP